MSYLSFMGLHHIARISWIYIGFVKYETLHLGVAPTGVSYIIRPPFINNDSLESVVHHAPREEV